MDNDASGLLMNAIGSIDKEIRSLSQERIVLERTLARFRHDALHGTVLRWLNEKKIGEVNEIMGNK